MKKLLSAATILMLFFALSCKKDSVTTDNVPVVPKNYITKFTSNNKYDGVIARDQEYVFSYDTKGKLESITQTTRSINAGTVAFTNQQTSFFTYNSEGLTSEIKTLGKLSNGTESINIERFIYDRNKIVEMRPFVVTNGIEQPHTMGIYTFKYNNNGKLISTSIADELRSEYTYTNDTHTKTAFGTFITDLTYHTSILHPANDYVDSQKLIISRLIEDASILGYGQASKFIPKKISDKYETYDFQATSNDKNLPIQIIRQATSYNAVQTMNFEYKTF